MTSHLNKIKPKLLVVTIKAYDIFFFKIYLLILERKREREWGKRQREERQNPQADSPLSAGHDAGLHPRTLRS